MSGFLVGIPTLNRYDLLGRCLAAVGRSFATPARILVVDNGRRLKPREGVQIHRPLNNLGVAASWNLIAREAFARGLDAIILNDDVVPSCVAFERLLSYQEPIVLIGWPIFRLTPRAFERIGPFDESFWPAYREDNDYVWRAKVAGVPIRLVKDTASRHAGSATIARFPVSKRDQFLRTTELRDYYVRKWGGPPGRERFEEPFDGARRTAAVV